MPTQVSSIDNFNKLLDANKYVVVLFTASWSSVYGAVNEFVTSCSNDPSYSKIDIIVVDFDSLQQLAATYSVTKVPAFCFVKNGSVVERADAEAGISDSVKKAFEKFRDEANADVSVLGRVDTSSSSIKTQLGKYVPKGYHILNENIHFGDFEALNALSVKEGAQVKEVFKLDGSNAVFSDSDSQMIFYVPFANIAKVYSVLLKLKKPVELENANLDEDDIEEVQFPNTIKIWGNRLHIISFDDTEADAPHVEAISVDGDDVWYECRLKFVRFQNVQSLNIFVDGDDDDFHTVIDKIVIVGLSGDETDHKNMLEKMVGGEEE